MGLIRLFLHPEINEIHDLCLKTGNEFVISVAGIVIRRESMNLNMQTIDIEIDVLKIARS